MGVEIGIPATLVSSDNVMPREGHGSRNRPYKFDLLPTIKVMPREGHGSRNPNIIHVMDSERRHAPRGAWE